MAAEAATLKEHREGATTANVDGPLRQTRPGNLVHKVQRLEAEIDDLFEYLKNYKTELQIKLDHASLRSREEVSEMLGASLSQVYRWTESGQLRATILDRKPRYRPDDVQLFIEARARIGKPPKKIKKPDLPSIGTKRKSTRRKRRNMKKGIIS